MVESTVAVSAIKDTEQSTLITLPAEIHLLIFRKHLDGRVSSTCLGLTCRKLYHIHKGVHGTVPLHATEFGFKAPGFRGEVIVDLSTILRGWMWESAKLVWCGEWGCFRFVTKERKEVKRKQFMKMVAIGVVGILANQVLLKRVENYAENEKWALQVIDELGFEKGG